MRGWRVRAKTVRGRELLLENYAKPSRADRITTRIVKVSDEPLVYDVIVKQGRIARMLGAMSEEMVNSVYKSFVKASGLSKPVVKRHLEVTLI